MKKKAKMSEFIHNLARGHMTSVVFYLVSSAMAEENAEKKGKAQFKRRSFHVPNLIPI